MKSMERKKLKSKFIALCAANKVEPHCMGKGLETFYFLERFMALAMLSIS